jgi:predicted nucleic acid-binding protein
MNVLVDTPIWSVALRRRRDVLSGEQIRWRENLAELTREKRARVIGPVRQEILSGIREVAAFRQIRDGLRAFPDEVLLRDDYEYAAEISNLCRAAGLASTPVDVLICAVAVRRGWEIFTTDGDFARYGRHVPVALYHPREY